MATLVGLFKTPKIAKTPGPPTIDQASVANNERMALAKRQGRASTIIGGASDSSGVATGPATKTLLGQ